MPLTPLDEDDEHPVALSREQLRQELTHHVGTAFADNPGHVMHFDHADGENWGGFIQKMLIRIPGVTQDFPALHGKWEPFNDLAEAAKKLKILDVPRASPLGKFLLYLTDRVIDNYFKIPQERRSSLAGGPENKRKVLQYHITLMRGTVLIMAHIDEADKDGPGWLIVNFSDKEVWVTFRKDHTDAAKAEMQSLGMWVPAGFMYGFSGDLRLLWTHTIYRDVEHAVPIAKAAATDIRHAVCIRLGKPTTDQMQKHLNNFHPPPGDEQSDKEEDYDAAEDTDTAEATPAAKKKAISKVWVDQTSKVIKSHGDMVLYSTATKGEQTMNSMTTFSLSVPDLKQPAKWRDYEFIICCPCSVHLQEKNLEGHFVPKKRLGCMLMHRTALVSDKNLATAKFTEPYTVTRDTAAVFEVEPLPIGDTKLGSLRIFATAKMTAYLEDNTIHKSPARHTMNKILKIIKKHMDENARQTPADTDAKLRVGGARKRTRTSLTAAEESGAESSDSTNTDTSQQASRGRSRGKAKPSASGGKPAGTMVPRKPFAQETILKDALVVLKSGTTDMAAANTAGGAFALLAKQHVQAATQVQTDALRASASAAQHEAHAAKTRELQATAAALRTAHEAETRELQATAAEKEKAHEAKVRELEATVLLKATQAQHTRDAEDKERRRLKKIADKEEAATTAATQQAATNAMIAALKTQLEAERKRATELESASLLAYQKEATLAREQHAADKLLWEEKLTKIAEAEKLRATEQKAELERRDAAHVVQQHDNHRRRLETTRDLRALTHHHTRDMHAFSMTRWPPQMQYGTPVEHGMYGHAMGTDRTLQPDFPLGSVPGGAPYWPGTASMGQPTYWGQLDPMAPRTRLTAPPWGTLGGPAEATGMGAPPLPSPQTANATAPAPPADTRLTPHAAGSSNYPGLAAQQAYMAHGAQPPTMYGAPPPHGQLSMRPQFNPAPRDWPSGRAAEQYYERQQMEDAHASVVNQAPNDPPGEGR
jgi:hypothetical protein